MLSRHFISYQKGPKISVGRDRMLKMIRINHSSDYNYSEFQRMINQLDTLGFSQQTDEEYRQSVEKALKELENEDKE